MQRIHKKACLLWLCGSFILENVSLQAQVKADFIISADTVCTNISDNFTSTASGGTAPYSYLWKLDNHNYAFTNHSSIIFSKAGTYYVSLLVTDANGSKDSLTKTVWVLESPKVIYSATLVPGYCSVIAFQATDTSSTSSGSKYVWVGDGAPGYAPIFIKGRTGAYQYTRGGTYHYTLIVTGKNGCKSSYSDSFNIARFPSISLSKQPYPQYHDTTVCSNTMLTLTATPSDGTPPYTIWWGDRLPPHDIYGATFRPTIVKDTAFGVWMADVNGCENYDSIWVRALPSPNAKWTVIDSGKAAYFHAVDASYTDTLYHWGFGDGSSAASYEVNHVYSNQNIYDASLTVTNSMGCSGSYDSMINAGNFSFYLYPNPFHTLTSIEYILTQKTRVQILLYDIAGKIIERVADETQLPGFHQERIGADEPDLAPGTYFLRINMDDTHATLPILKF